MFLSHIDLSVCLSPSFSPPPLLPGNEKMFSGEDKKENILEGKDELLIPTGAVTFLHVLYTMLSR